MSLTIDHFRTAALQTNGKVGVNNAGQLETKGTDVKGRVVEWFRSKTTQGRREQATATQKAKSEFISAIRKEYGDVMAERASYQLGKSTSLKSRTIQAILKNADSNRGDFIKLHNMRSLQTEVANLLQKLGGLEHIYNDEGTAKLLRGTYGLSLPKFDSSVAEKFIHELVELLPKDRVRNTKYPLEKSEIQQHIGRAVVKEMWRQGQAGFGPEAIQQLTSQGTLNSRIIAAEKIFGIGAKMVGTNPELKTRVCAAALHLFQQVRLVDPELASSIGKKATSLGLIPPGTDGIAQCYDSAATTAPRNVDRIKLLCAAEKCHQIGERHIDRQQLTRRIEASLELFVREQSPIVGRYDDLKHPPNLAWDRRALASLRDAFVNQDLGNDYISQKFAELTKEIYVKSLEEFGVDVNSQTFILFGSGSRDEMFPFSDLEFAVLTDMPSNEVPENLKRALEYFEMRITALGETPLGLEESIPIREGFCFDPGGNAPSTILQAGTFLGTAQQVAAQIDPKSLILTEVFSSAKCLVGGQDRCVQYLQHVDRTFSRTIPEGEMTVGQGYAINNLNDHLQKMNHQANPIAKGDLSKLSKINAKELSRFPIFLASSLCKFHGVPSSITTTVDRLQELARLGILTEQEATKLEESLEKFGALRLKAELYHQGQEHTIFKDDVEGEVSLEPMEWQGVLNVIEGLRPIFGKLTQFAESPASVFQKPN